MVRLGVCVRITVRFNLNILLGTSVSVRLKFMYK